MNKRVITRKPIEQLNVLFSSKDVSYKLTESHQVSAASVDYSGSSRRKTGRGEGSKKLPSPVEDRVKKFNYG